MVRVKKKGVPLSTPFASALHFGYTLQAMSSGDLRHWNGRRPH